MSPEETEPKITSFSPDLRAKERVTWFSFSISPRNDSLSFSTFFFSAVRSISIIFRFEGVTSMASFLGSRKFLP